MLDRHNDALSFLSEGGFRLFLPASLIADLQDALKAADPLFHLTHGFSDCTMPLPVGRKTFEFAAIQEGRDESGTRDAT